MLNKSGVKIFVRRGGQDKLRAGDDERILEKIIYGGVYGPELPLQR